MTNNMTTPFAGTEDTATVKARLTEVLERTQASGATSGYTDWGDARDDINVMLATGNKISGGEIASSFRSKLNGVIDLDSASWENAMDELRGTDPQAFILADDTARIFGPDGVTPVSAPGTAVSLAADDWEGLEVSGTERITNPSFATDTDWTKGAGWTISGGQALFAGGADANINPTLAPLTNGEFYFVEVDVGSIASGSLAVRVGNGSITDFSITLPGVYRFATVSDGTAFTLRSVSAGAIAVNSVSVKEITNWPGYQNTAAARPTWGRAPAQVRNLLTNSDLAGAVAGTPGTAPTGYVLAFGGGGETVSVAADGLLGGNSVRLRATTNRQFYNMPSITVLPNTTYHYTVLAEVFDNGSSPMQGFMTNGAAPVGSVTTWEVDGVPGNSIPAAGLRTFTMVLAVGATGGTWAPRMGIGCDVARTGDVRFWAPRYTLAADASLPYQRRGPVPTDITESGVTSFGLLSLDGSDDALLHQLAAGGTVSVALFGRGGSYLIPSITLAAPSVLQLGPLSVLDDGVLVSGCPTGILRAVGTVPWSSRFELVGYAIMKANPSAEEQARAMRYFAAFGARGWLVEGPELIVNGAFTSDLAGWVDQSTAPCTAAFSSGAARLSTITSAAGLRGSLRQTLTFEIGKAYRIKGSVLAGSTGSGVIQIYTRLSGTTFLLTGQTVAAGSSLDTIAVANIASAEVEIFSPLVIGNYSDWDNISVKALTPEF